jgi:hypothetical protein
MFLFLTSNALTMRTFLKPMLTCLLAVFCLNFTFSQASYYFPAGGTMDPKIPSPEVFLGYEVGFQHTRHDKVVEYLKLLDQISDRVKVNVIGRTYENREQLSVLFTSPSNHSRLEDIRKSQIAQKHTGNTSDIPLVIQVAFNIHGNEPSGGEAALLTAYYLAASKDAEVISWLDNMVILMDPIINPDGRDRHTNWVNMHRAFPPIADPQDREHNEIWPGGRFNHYWFDLNRDWFLGVHPETRNRMKVIHDWRPYIQTDHHEMGTNSTYYFDPGKPSSDNPVVPEMLYKTIYPLYAKYYAEALNEIGSLYFTKEVFDKLYPGYGSSYMNFYGGAGFLFEQASSRGHVQETPTIPLTFAFTIRNQFRTALASIKASHQEKAQLLALRKNFYQTAADQARRSPIKGYVVGDSKDFNRTAAFIDLLLLHEIEVYELTSDQRIGNQNFEAGKAYFVPTEQPEYIMVKSVFEKDIPYSDSLFYDASTWSVVHAFNLPYAELRAPLSKDNRLSSTPVLKPASVARSSYAYLAESTDYNIHKALWLLHQGGVVVQSAFRPFSIAVVGKEKSFGHGSIIIPVQQQRINSDSLHRMVQMVSQQANIPIYPVTQGMSLSGIDLGSNNVQTMKKPEVAMLVGTGVFPNEAGEAWHLLDQRVGLQFTKLDVLNLGRADLNRYNTLIMVSGSYEFINQAGIQKIKNWINEGGTLITIKTATDWAIRNGLTQEKLLPADSSGGRARFNFEDAGYIEGAKSMGGSIFTVDLDITHPLGFGFTDRKVSVFRNGLSFLQPSANPYSTIAKYTDKPLVGGYIHPSTLRKVSGSASILVSSEGRGRVILMTDNPNFRGIWYGTNKLFLNAIFYGGLIQVPYVNLGYAFDEDDD